jgi:hypothetical protein
MMDWTAEVRNSMQIWSLGPPEKGCSLYVAAALHICTGKHVEEPFDVAQILGPVCDRRERDPSWECLTDTPPALADLGNAGFPFGIVLKEIHRGYERPDLTEFELYACTAAFLAFKYACQFKPREIVANRFGI